MFLAILRAKEASLYQPYVLLKRPVLDVGCGDGFFAQTVFGTVDVGLDMPESRMAEAKKFNVYKKLATYDGVHIPFRANTFSTVISNCVLEHVEDLNGLLCEIRRVLKPGGVFLTTVMAKPWEEHLFGAKIFGGWYRRYMRRKQEHRNLLTRREWRNAFRNAKFTVIDEIGYLPPRACAFIDIAHYLSLPSLLAYLLFKKWVLWPGLTRWYPQSWFAKILEEPVAVDRAGAIFFTLQKHSKV